MESKTEWCEKCRQWLPPDAFWRRASGYKVSGGCKKCQKGKIREKQIAPAGMKYCGWCQRSLPFDAFWKYKSGKPISGCIECRKGGNIKVRRSWERRNRTRTSKNGKPIKWPCPATWREGSHVLTPSDVTCMAMWRDGYRVVDNGIVANDGSPRVGRIFKSKKYILPDGRKSRMPRWYSKASECSAWQFAAFCHYGAACFQKGVLIRARDHNFMNLSKDNLYLQTRQEMLKACAVRKVYEDPAPLDYSPREDPNRAVRENQDLMKLYPRCHMETVWLAMLEAAKKFDPEKRGRKGVKVPLRGWMRYIIKKRIKDKMRDESIRYHDDAPGYKKIRGTRARVVTTASIFSEGFEHVTGTRFDG